MKPISSLKRILNESSECVLAVIPQRKCSNLLFFKIVRPNIDSCYPFRFFCTVGIICFCKSCGLCSLKLIVGNCCISVKITHAVFNLKRTFFINQMVENKLSGIALCFIFLEILMRVISFTFDVKHITSQTVFDSCIDTEIHFCFIIEINKQFRVQYKTFKFWNGRKTNFCRVVSSVSIMRSKYGCSDFLKLLSVKTVDV